MLSSLTSSCDSARAFGEAFWFMTSLVSLSRYFPWLIPNKVCLLSVSTASSTFSEKVSKRYSPRLIQMHVCLSMCYPLLLEAM